MVPRDRRSKAEVGIVIFFRVPYANFDSDGTFSFSGGGFPQPSFFVPFLDARRDPISQGVAGIRMFQSNVKFSYSSDYYDWGFDFVTNAGQSQSGSWNFIMGPAFATINQDFQHNVSGFFGGNLDQLRQSFTSEQIDENFYGLRLGLRGETRLGSRLSFNSTFNAFLYYSQAELNALQRLNTSNGPIGQLDINVTDKQNGFVPRLDLELGLKYQLNQAMALTLLYRFGAWFDVAAVENPSLQNVEIGGDDRWVGNAPAHLVKDDLFTNTIMAGFVWER